MFSSEKEQASQLVMMIYYAAIFGTLIAVAVTIWSTNVKILPPVNRF